MKVMNEARKVQKHNEPVKQDQMQSVNYYQHELQQERHELKQSLANSLQE